MHWARPATEQLKINATQFQWVSKNVSRVDLIWCGDIMRGCECECTCLGQRGVVSRERQTGSVFLLIDFFCGFLVGPHKWPARVTSDKRSGQPASTFSSSHTWWILGAIINALRRVPSTVLALHRALVVTFFCGFLRSRANISQNLLLPIELHYFSIFINFWCDSLNDCHFNFVTLILEMHPIRTLSNSL